MQRNQNLIVNMLPYLKNFTFYRQRFDACPHFMFFVGDAHGSDTNHSKYPYGQRVSCAYFSKNKADWYHPLSELEFTASKIMDVAKSNRYIAQEMIEEFKPWEEKFYIQCLELSKIDLKKLNNQELLKIYNELSVVYVKKLNSSPLIDGFALSTDTVISQKVEQFLERKGLLSKFISYFEILTAPTFLSFLQQEELEFLKIVKTITASKLKKENKNNNSNHRLNNHNNNGLPEKIKDAEYLLKKHQQDFFWINNNYVKDEILGIDHFKLRLNELKDISVDDKIKGLLAFPLTNKNKKNDLIKELHLPEELVALLDITDKFSYWQDERKKGTFWATHYFSLLLEEISKRTGYTLQELKYAMPPEMKDIIENKIEHKVLQERFEGCFLIWTLDQFDIITNQKTIGEITQSDQKRYLEKEIRGMSVSLGKVKGIVKIVESAEEIDKVKTGDILVAVMTRPDYVIAMKRAAGFITDEGGITCHAAIIAREIGAPCIVGTRIATKTLKDGDFVELDANHGVIRILH